MVTGVAGVKFVKRVRLTSEAAGAIEARQSPEPTAALDFGQGVKLPVGETLYLFSSVRSKRRSRPYGIAHVRADGLFVEHRKQLFRIEPSRGSLLKPAMLVCQRFSHRRMVSLSPWRQWHVLRENQFIPLVELKDPRQAQLVLSALGRRARALTKHLRQIWRKYIMD